MKEGQPFGPVFDEMSILAARLEAADLGLTEPIMCMKIVASLPPSWLHNAEYMNTNRDKWTVLWLKEKILEQELFRLAAARSTKTSKVVGETEEDFAAAGAVTKKGKLKGKQKEEEEAQAKGRRRKGLPFINYSDGCWYCRKTCHL